MISCIDNFLDQDDFKVCKRQQENLENLEQEFNDGKITALEFLDAAERIRKDITKAIPTDKDEDIWIGRGEEGSTYFANPEDASDTVSRIVAHIDTGESVTSLVKAGKIDTKLEHVATFLKNHGPGSSLPVEWANDFVRKLNLEILARAVYSHGIKHKGTKNVDKFVQMLNKTQHKDIRQVTEQDLIDFAKTTNEMTQLKGKQSLTRTLINIKMLAPKNSSFTPLMRGFNVEHEDLKTAYTKLGKESKADQKTITEKKVLLKTEQGEDLIQAVDRVSKIENPYIRNASLGVDKNAPIRIQNQQRKELKQQQIDNLKSRLQGGTESIAIRAEEINKITPKHIAKDGQFYTIKLSRSPEEGRESIVKRSKGPTVDRNVNISKKLYDDLQSFINEYKIQENDTLFPKAMYPVLGGDFTYKGFWNNVGALSLPGGKPITKLGKNKNVQKLQTYGHKWIRSHAVNKLETLQNQLVQKTSLGNGNFAIAYLSPPELGLPMTNTYSLLNQFIDYTLGHDISISQLKATNYAGNNLKAIMDNPLLAGKIQKALRKYLSVKNPTRADVDNVLKEVWDIANPKDPISKNIKVKTWFKDNKEAHLKISLEPGVVGMGAFGVPRFRVQGAQQAIDRVFNKLDSLFGGKIKDTAIENAKQIYDELAWNLGLVKTGFCVKCLLAEAV